MAANAIRNEIESYIAIGAYNEKYKLLSDSGIDWRAYSKPGLLVRNASFPLSENKNIYITYDFTISRPRTVYGYVVAGDRKFGNLTLVPFSNEYTTYRTFCLVMHSIANHIIKDWWSNYSSYTSGVQYSSYETNPITLNFSARSDYESAEGLVDLSTTNIGVILHPKETENLFVFPENLEDDDDYISAAIEVDDIEDVVSVTFEKVG